jgi:hypothetical protein
MTYFGLALWAAVGIGLCVVAWQARCWAGVHPRQQVRMLSGETRKRFNDRGELVAVESASAWQCGRCLRVLDETVIEPNLAVNRKLRQQVPAARERSKVLNFEVVRKDGTA